LGKLKLLGLVGELRELFGVFGHGLFEPVTSCSFAGEFIA
jgi:hypothetical protein